MSTEKLSKPVGFIEQSGMAYLRSGADADIWPDGGRGGDIPLYSQEYVSALLVEMERYKQYAKERDAENESLALTAGRLRVELEAKDNRITELEAKTAMTMGVGSGNGNLFVHGDYDSIKAAQAIVLENESLRAKLATPVRLPTALFCPEEYVGSLLWSETEAYNKAISKCAEGIRAAGFKVDGG